MARSSASPVRSAAAISGGGKAASAPSSALAHSRQHTPGAVRPARPCRCTASARVTRSVTSRVMPEAGSNRARRARPPSTTTVIPGMVNDVSAMAVASTSLRRPSGSGAMAARWASNAIAPNSGRTAQPQSLSAAATRRISPSPGQNASTSPGASSSACRTNPAIAASQRTSRDNCRGSQTVSTGNARPSAVIRGASPISAATGAASSVADIGSSTRSGRRAPRMSSAKARPRSAFSERSWNSSNRMAPTPGNSGSSWIIRVRMPSVTTSIRVAPDTRLSPRMR